MTPVNSHTDEPGGPPGRRVRGAATTAGGPARPPRIGTRAGRKQSRPRPSPQSRGPGPQPGIRPPPHARPESLGAAGSGPAERRRRSRRRGRADHRIPPARPPGRFRDWQAESPLGPTPPASRAARLRAVCSEEAVRVGRLCCHCWRRIRVSNRPRLLRGRPCAAGCRRITQETRTRSSDSGQRKQSESTASRGPGRRSTRCARPG